MGCNLKQNDMQKNFKQTVQEVSRSIYLSYSLFIPSQSCPREGMGHSVALKPTETIGLSAFKIKKVKSPFYLKEGM